MVSTGVLLECLDSPDVTSVRVVGRTPTGLHHDKLTEIAHADFGDFGPVEDQLGDVDACLWCLGVSAGGMTEEAYRRITVEFTRVAATTLLRLNPGMAMCFLSGQGTGGKAMWAKVKEEAEALLGAMDFSHAVMFRPGLIRPMRGARSKTTSYRILYAVLTPVLPLLVAALPGLATSSVVLGRAMIRAALGQAPKDILENRDINELGR